MTEHEFSSAGAANYESDVTAIATTAQANLPGAWGYMRELWDAAGLLCAPLSQGRQAIAMLTQASGWVATGPGTGPGSVLCSRTLCAQSVPPSP